MAAKFIVLALTVASCTAVPVWIDGNEYIPGMVLRIGRSPSMAYGFGSGFSSNIGGISHSTSIGSSFQSGDAEAYGGALAGSNNGAFARSVGVAHAAPSPYPQYPHPYQQSAASAYNGGLGHNAYGSAISSSQNYGNNFGSAVSSAQTHNGLQYGAASSAVQNGGPGRFQSAVSSAHNLRGLGYDSSVAAANSGSGLGYGSAVSSANSNNGFDGYNAAVSSAQNVGGFSGSSSQTVQHRAGNVQHSGASSVNAPGLQAAQSHAVNSGFY